MFKSFRTRLLVLLAGLLVLALAASFLAVHRASVANARRVIAADLEQDAAVFRRLLGERTQHLVEAARLLSSDFAFKEACATSDRATLLSVMHNHLGRMTAGDRMLVVSLDGERIVDTGAAVAGGRANPWPRLVASAAADDYGEAAALVGWRGRLLQMAVVPLLAPDLKAWILIGFAIDDAYARDLRQLVLSEVAVVDAGSADRGLPARLVAGTRAEAQRAALLPPAAAGHLAAGHLATVELGGEAYVSTALVPESTDATEVLVVLQRPLAAELAPFQRLRTTLLVLFMIGLTVSIAAAVMLARSVTRPVLELAGRARRIVDGDYTPRPESRRRDELGTLGRSFDHMVRGLAEREHVRDLLGKVVSPAIAQELMSKEVELGGEERVVSVLFSDVRNFTELCEGRDAEEVLSLLNRYLTEVGGIIDAHGGVVDKYMGDAVMALFGAPLRQEDDATRAVACGIAMRGCVERLNRELEHCGLPRLEWGIGIHTGRVVAGNVGSPARLNYTVIGDGVNLAARLEGLTRRYRVPIVVSETTRREAPGFVYRELDRVCVKGRHEAVTIFQPLRETNDDAERRQDLRPTRSGRRSATRKRDRPAHEESRKRFEEGVMTRKHVIRSVVAVLLVGCVIGLTADPAIAQGPVVVTTYAELRDAFEDPQVTAIELGADIFFSGFDDPLERDSANDLSIDGAGFTISRSLLDSPGGIFLSLGGGALALENITLTGAESPFNGGAVSAGGDVVVANATFEDNISDGIFGGAISAQGSLTVTDSEFRDNSAFDGGGAIAAGDVITVTNSTFSGNRAGVRGGAIFGGSDGVHVTSSVFEDNRAISGGAIDIGGAEGHVTVMGTILDANSADGDGGAIRAPTVVVAGDSILQGNSAEGSGGATFAFTADGAVTVSDSTLTANHGFDGGAIFAEGAVSVTHSTLRENTSSSFGGAIDALGEVVVSHSTLDGNSADGSGGAIATDGLITVFASTLAGNDALGFDGGAIAAFGVGATLTNVTVSGNHAASGGGGVFTGGDLALLHATIVDNAADSGGNLSFHTDATLVSFGSVVALPANGGENCSFDAGTTTTSNGYNLTDDASCGFTDGTDIVGDPELAGLADNGGETATRTPRSGSSLIEAVPVGDCHEDVPNDQRDVARPQLGGCDIGAVEVEVPLAVDNLYQDVPRFAMFVAPDSLLDNDSGPPGMIVEVVSGPAHGALAVDPDGGFAYTLADPENPASSDSFTYVAILADAGGESYPSNEVTVTLELVDAPSGAPPLPVGLGVDLAPLAADGNGMLEPGESVEVAPVWRNQDVEALFLTGIASDLTGPEGPTYTLVADSADYGEVEPGELGDCRETGLCYRVEVGPQGVERPAKHWDAGFDETLAFVGLAGGGTSQPWALHIGDSFVDVPWTNPFYRFIETLLHHHVCSGCSATEYCPAAGTTRAQMAVFLLRAREGRDYLPPPCDPQAQVFEDVPADDPVCPWIEELSRRGAASGCGGGNYCPHRPVTRTQMATFLLRTLEGPGYTPPACTPGSPPFTDVPPASPFCPWVAELAARSITSGCGDGAYCPADSVSRAQMAVFLSRTFGLTLYGP